MPTLYKSSKNKPYILTSWGGQSGVKTLQLSSEGFAFLSQSGVKLGDTFSQALLNRLWQLGYLYTLGGGMEAPEPEQKLAAQFDTEQRKAARPQLAVQFDDAGWRLAVLFPELPPEWCASAQVLAKCGFTADGSEVNAIELWRGKGGAAAYVGPHVGAYQIKAVGGWPAEWEVISWCGSLPGLDETVTLFHADEDGGRRLESGELLTPGSEYILVSRRSSLTAKGAKMAPPDSVQCKWLGCSQDWSAWSLGLPDWFDPRVQQWAQQIGYALDEPAGAIRLLSPVPVSHSAYGAPQIEVGATALIEIAWPQNHGAAASPQFHLGKFDLDTWAPQWLRPIDVKRGQADAAYLALELHEVGAYKLESMVGGFQPVRFLVVDPAADGAWNAGPEPLSLMIEAGGARHVLRALDGDRRCELSVPKGSDVAVHMRAPRTARIYFERSDGGSLLRLREAAAVEIEDLLRTEIPAAAARRRRYEFELDAGAFGRLSVTVNPSRLETPIAQGRALSAGAAKRALWLSQVIPAQLCSDRIAVVAVPAVVQRRLRLLDEEYSALHALKVVPAGLWPYLLSVVRELDADLPTSFPRNIQS